MFSVARSKIGGLNPQQQKYVDAIVSGVSEKEAREIAEYKTSPKSDSITKAIKGLPVGEWSSAAKDYAFRLAIERISGKPLAEGFETWVMQRGRELEPEARAEHEIQSGVIVDRVGFIATDDRLFGASADGFIGDDDGAEYKCFIDPCKLRAFYIDEDASSVIDQVMGCLWITGRKRWHLGLYCPALREIGKHLWLKTFERDEEYIELLERDLVEFSGLVSDYEIKLREI